MNKLIIAVLLATFIFRPSQLRACDCSGQSSIENAYKSSDFVVHGNVIQIRDVSLSETIDSSKFDSIKERLSKGQTRVIQTYSIREVKIKILKNFKGAFFSDTLTVYTFISSITCGYTYFRAGEDFIIYGKKGNQLAMLYLFEKLLEEINEYDTPWISSCSRTAKASGKEEELEILSKIDLPMLRNEKN